MQASQASNGYSTFAQQCRQGCLSAYEASPAYNISMPQVDADAPPRLLHFIFLGETKVSFTFMDYLVIRAAYFRLQPESIYLHTNVACLDSPLWDLIRPMIGKHLIFKPVTEIYGNAVSGLAHFSDIARIQVLQKYGGLYMDIDSLSLRPFSDEMWDPPKGLSMGYQYKPFNHVGCGVIVARKKSPFLQRWMESYKTFNDTHWDTHTVKMAGELAAKHPDEITLYPETHFYVPSFMKEHLDMLWQEQPVNSTKRWPFATGYAPHYWGSMARFMGKIQRMTPSTILKENVAIHQILRALLPHPFFSVVVDCKKETDVQKTLSTVQGQTFSLWEVLLVDCPKEVDVGKNKDIRRVSASKTEAKGVWMLQGPLESNKVLGLSRFMKMGPKRIT